LTIINRRKALASVAGAAGAGIASAMVAASPARAQDQVFTWRMQTHHAPSGALAESGDMFVADIERLSKGRLKIQRLDADTLTPNSEILQGVSLGLVEMGWSDPAYHVGFMPELNIGSAPFMFRDFGDAYEVFFYRGVFDIFRDRYRQNGVELVGMMPHYKIPLLSRKPVRSIEDFKGLKVRTIGARQTMMSQLGAAPVTIPLPEVYTSFATGVIDAATNGPESSFNDYAWTEVAKYIIYPALSSFPLPVNDVYVNPDAWARLPEDLQEIVRDVAAKSFARHPFHFAKHDLDIRPKYDEMGVERIYLSDADASKMAEAASVIWRQVADGNEAGKQLVKIYTDYMRQVGYTDFTV
jgi:TRAP-type C4-dicarboxylate transport system substrate-binding protein